MFGNASILLLALPQPRQIWQLERQERWFETMWGQRDENGYQNYWKVDFRMSGESFQKLVWLVSPAIIKKDTQFRRTITVEKHVAIAMWRPSTRNSFRSITKVFTVGKSTAVTICKEFCRELKRRSLEYINFSVTRHENAETILKFKADVKCKIPQVVGAIDGTHIPILTLATESKNDYYIRKKKAHNKYPSRSRSKFNVFRCCNRFSRMYAWCTSFATYRSISHG